MNTSFPRILVVCAQIIIVGALWDYSPALAGAVFLGLALSGIIFFIAIDKRIAELNARKRSHNT